MVNNFKKIRSIITFPNEGDDFYFCQIIRRRKENADDKTGSSLINSYYIDSFEKFDKRKQRIIDECTLHNARAYFNPNRRSYKKCALQMLKIVIDSILSHEYRFGMRAFDTACARFSNEKPKKWVVDIDLKDPEIIEQYKILINSCKPRGQKILHVLPTANGVHFISLPFNIQEFHGKLVDPIIFKGYEVPDIKKDNHTLLFIP